MAIPDYQTIMLPLLKIAADKKEHSKQEAVTVLANQFHLTETERKVLLYSGKQELFDNRVGWAKTYLKKAGLINSARWGYFSITDRGAELLKTNPLKIDVHLLRKYYEFKEFVQYKGASNDDSIEIQTETPKETMSNVAQRINDSLVKELLQQLKNVSPKSFENIVVDLMIKMHYGSNFKDAIRALGKVGDEGVDGVINEDYLGLSRVYLQAKRYTDKAVGHPEIRDFIGALDFKHAERGIFITTSTFTKEVKENVDRSSKRIILIDGNELASLLIANNVGVTVEDTFELKRIDIDYFTEE
ncbi:MAG: restriction endonuclease [Dehalococcoidales bacterium]|nr:restriction endonuclease [Dehalococcoidales bacterium]